MLKGGRGEQSTALDVSWVFAVPVVGISPAGDGTYDNLRVDAIMLFPNATKSREQYFAVNYARGTTAQLEDAVEVGVGVATLRFLIDAPSYEELEAQAFICTKRALVAGDLLAALFLMHRFKVDEPSINKAIFVAQNYMSRDGFSDESKYPQSERMIRKCWTDFQPVSHFWAARRLNARPPNQRRPSEP